METTYAAHRRREAQIARSAGVFAVLLGCLVQALAAGPMNRPLPRAVDPNRAPTWELTLLPGIGRRRAARIGVARLSERIATRHALAAAAGLGAHATETLLHSQSFRLAYDMPMQGDTLPLQADTMRR